MEDREEELRLERLHAAQAEVWFAKTTEDEDLAVALYCSGLASRLVARIMREEDPARLTICEGNAGTWIRDPEETIREIAREVLEAVDVRRLELEDKRRRGRA